MNNADATTAPKQTLTADDLEYAIAMYSTEKLTALIPTLADAAQVAQIRRQIRARETTTVTDILASWSNL